MRHPDPRLGIPVASAGSERGGSRRPGPWLRGLLMRLLGPLWRGRRSHADAIRAGYALRRRQEANLQRLACPACRSPCPGGAEGDSGGITNRGHHAATSASASSLPAAAGAPAALSSSEFAAQAQALQAALRESRWYAPASLQVALFEGAASGRPLDEVRGWLTAGVANAEDALALRQLGVSPERIGNAGLGQQLSVGLLSLDDAVERILGSLPDPDWAGYLTWADPAIGRWARTSGRCARMAVGAPPAPGRPLDDQASRIAREPQCR